MCSGPVGRSPVTMRSPTWAAAEPGWASGDRPSTTAIECWVVTVMVGSFGGWRPLEVGTDRSRERVLSDPAGHWRPEVCGHHGYAVSRSVTRTGAGSGAAGMSWARTVA